MLGGLFGWLIRYLAEAIRTGNPQSSFYSCHDSVHSERAWRYGMLLSSGFMVGEVSLRLSAMFSLDRNRCGASTSTKSLFRYHDGTRGLLL